MTAAITLGEIDVIALRLALPYQGVGTLEAELDLAEGEDLPSGTVLLIFAGGAESVSYEVTVIEVLTNGDASRETSGRASIYAVQGKGGLRTVIEGQDYGDQVAPKLVAEDILELAKGAGGKAEAGALDELAALPPLTRWMRAAGAAWGQLDRLAGALPGIVARVRRDGAVTVGPETWPVHDSGAVADADRWVHEPDDQGLGELALDAPTLAPGMAVQRPSGTPGTSYHIAEVVYEVSEETEGLQTSVRLLRASTPATTRAAFDASVRRALPPLGLSVPWWARVVAQDDDGALGLVLDRLAPRPGAPAPPALALARVPYAPGLPGCALRVPLGARCLVEWVGGREDAPLVRTWAAGQLGPIRLTFDYRRGQVVLEAAGMVALHAIGKVKLLGASIELNDRMLATKAGAI